MFALYSDGGKLEKNDEGMVEGWADAKTSDGFKDGITTEPLMVL